MNEIKCPHCHKAFKIDEASFAAILKQVRDSEFEKELHERIDSEVRAAEAKTKLELQTESSQKEAELIELRAKLDGVATETKLAVTEAVNKIEKQRDELAVRLDALASLFFDVSPGVTSNLAATFGDINLSGCALWVKIFGKLCCRCFGKRIEG